MVHSYASFTGGMLNVLVVGWVRKMPKVAIKLSGVSLRTMGAMETVTLRVGLLPS